MAEKAKILWEKKTRLKIYKKIMKNLGIKWKILYQVFIYKIYIYFNLEVTS